MERPFNGGYTILSDYSLALMTEATVQNTDGLWEPFQKTSNLVQLNMYNEGYNGSDNNLLSSALAVPEQSSIFFYWFNFH